MKTQSGTRYLCLALRTTFRESTTKFPFQIMHLTFLCESRNNRLVITKGYGVRVTTIKRQNAFAATLCFV